VRLNAYLARAGVASRRRCDELIGAGRVRVNGRRGELHMRVGATDVVEVDGHRVVPQAPVYVLLFKPAGVVTTARDPQRRPTVVDLVAHRARIVPVGRLDVDTTGALLLTNDGVLAHRLAHPRYRIEKVYEAEVEGAPERDALGALRVGVDLEDGRTAPASALVLRRCRETTLVELTLHEGRKHQVKRMCAAVGHPVRRLHRSRYAGLDLRDLAPGQWRELTPGEAASLRSAAGLDAG
jgi:23S rRNA pseudouridine2605 synthase